MRLHDATADVQSAIHSLAPEAIPKEQRQGLVNHLTRLETMLAEFRGRVEKKPEPQTT